MLSTHMRTLLFAAYHEARLPDPFELDEFCAKLERSEDALELARAASELSGHQGRSKALVDLRLRLAGALLGNQAMLPRALAYLAWDNDVVRALHGAICSHPNAEEETLLQLAYTASLSLIGMPEAYESIDAVAPGLGRSAAFVERLGINDSDQFTLAVKGLRGQSTAVTEVFVTLLLDRYPGPSVSECLAAAIAISGE